MRRFRMGGFSSQGKGRQRLIIMEHWYIIAVAALAASTVAAITGTGGGIILLPVLAGILGIREAVPAYALAQLIGNTSRVAFNYREIKLPVVAWFALGAVPMAVLGSWLFTRIPDAGLFRLLGVFLIVSVILRRRHGERLRNFHPACFAPIGGIFSMISSIVGSAGPFLAPFYLAYGLTKGAFIGTEALGTAIMHIVKLSSYQGLGVMTARVWLAGLMIGPLMICGSYAGKCALDRLPAKHFLLVVDVAILGFGLWFLIK